MAQSNDLTLTAKVVVAHEARITALENGTKNPGGGGTDPSKPTDPSVPDSGVNVDPGKSLTGQKEVWSGATKQGAEDKLTLDSSISKNLDNVGDGLQFVFKIVKTPITNGAQGTPVDLTPIATTSTTPVSGKYVCSVPVPISIKKGSFAVGTTLTVKLDGIGEGLSGVTVSMAPEVQLTLNNDGNISVKPIEGYAFDKLTTGNTGAYYDVIVTSVTTYTVAAAVVPLANGTVIWSGSQTAPSGSVSMSSKANGDWSNIGDGIAITLTEPFINGWTERGMAWKTNPIKIQKADLVEGHKLSFDSENVEFLGAGVLADVTLTTTKPAVLAVTIGKGKITFTLTGLVGFSGRTQDVTADFTVTQVSTYLN